MADVWDFGPSDATLTNVLVVLANSADDDGGNCFPGTALIAARTRFSERTVTRAIAALEREGWITVLQRGAGRPKGRNRHEKSAYMSQYLINVERLKQCQRVTFSEEKKKVTPIRKKVTGATGKGDFHDNPPYPLFGIPVSDPSGIQKPIPPNPLVTEGASGSLSANYAALDGAVDQVCSALGIPTENRRLRWLLRGVVKLAMEKGEPAPTVALAMIAAWNRQAAMSHLLHRKYGLRKFFGEGIWRDENRWLWNEELLRERARASVGSR